VSVEVEAGVAWGGKHFVGSLFAPTAASRALISRADGLVLDFLVSVVALPDDCILVFGVSDGLVSDSVV
jgi:hypothetical protein